MDVFSICSGFGRDRMVYKMRRLHRRNRVPRDELTVLDVPLLSGFMSGVLVQDHSQGNNTGTAAGDTGLPLPLYPGYRFTAASEHKIGAVDTLVSAFPVSVNCWFKTSNGDQIMAAGMGNTGAANRYVHIGKEADETGAYVIRVSGTAGASIVVATGTALNDGLWHMVTGVSENTTVHNIYVDSVLINTLANLKTWSAVANWSIGSRVSSTESNWWEGSIAEVKILAKALSAEEVQSIYNVTRFRYGVAS